MNLISIAAAKEIDLAKSNINILERSLILILISYISGVHQAAQEREATETRHQETLFQIKFLIEFFLI